MDVCAVLYILDQNSHRAALSTEPRVDVDVDADAAGAGAALRAEIPGLMQQVVTGKKKQRGY